MLITFVKVKFILLSWIKLSSYYEKQQYGVSFYMQYLAHWPEYFQVAESPSGEIMGYGKLIVS